MVSPPEKTVDSLFFSPQEQYYLDASFTSILLTFSSHSRAWQNKGFNYLLAHSIFK